MHAAGYSSVSVCPSVRLSVCLSVCPSVCLSVRPSVRPSVCLLFWVVGSCKMYLESESTTTTIEKKCEIHKTFNLEKISLYTAIQQ